MKLRLETVEDVKFFIKNRKQILRVNSDSEVTITTNLLNIVVNDFEESIQDLNRIIRTLRTNLAVESENLIENWIDESIDIMEDKPEEEIRKTCLEGVKEELANLKSEEDLDLVDLRDIKYNYCSMLSDCYYLTPEEIIEKIEKDLAEIEAE